jgi:hypothetical protein
VCKCSCLRTLLQLFVTFFLIYLNVFLSTTFLIIFIQCSSLNGRDEAWHLYETFTALCILMFLVSKWEGKTFWTERLEAFLVINHSLISSCMQFWIVTVMHQILFCTYHVALSKTILLELSRSFLYILTWFQSYVSDKCWLFD